LLTASCSDVCGSSSSRSNSARVCGLPR
jgi:hypothetical protein